MSGIASSLEQQFADHSQAEREAHIAELRTIEANGRGNVDVAAHAIVFPALIGLIACALIYSTLTRHDPAMARVVTTLACSVAVAALCAWFLFGPRKPRFTLTEEGLRLKNGVIAWDKIDDYGVTEHSTNGFTTHTSIRFELVPGFTPPPLGQIILFGQTEKVRKTDQAVIRQTLHVGAKGMNSDQLAERIGQFLAAARARAELRRLDA